MVYLLDSELGWLLHHEYTHCIVVDVEMEGGASEAQTYNNT